MFILIFVVIFLSFVCILVLVVSNPLDIWLFPILVQPILAQNHVTVADIDSNTLLVCLITSD